MNNEDEGTGSVGVVAAPIGVALPHSALASRQARKPSPRRLSESGIGTLFYRPFYVAQSTLSFGALMLYLRQQPDPAVWEAPPSAKPLLQAGRLAALWGMVSEHRLQAAHPKEYMDYRRKTRFFLGRQRPLLMSETGPGNPRRPRPE